MKRWLWKVLGSVGVLTCMMVQLTASSQSVITIPFKRPTQFEVGEGLLKWYYWQESQLLPFLQNSTHQLRRPYIEHAATLMQTSMRLRHTASDAGDPENARLQADELEKESKKFFDKSMWTEKRLARGVEYIFKGVEPAVHFSPPPFLEEVRGRLQRNEPMPMVDKELLFSIAIGSLPLEDSVGTVSVLINVPSTQRVMRLKQLLHTFVSIDEACSYVQRLLHRLATQQNRFIGAKPYNSNLRTDTYQWVQACIADIFEALLLSDGTLMGTIMHTVNHVIVQQGPVWVGFTRFYGYFMDPVIHRPSLLDAVYDGLIEGMKHYIVYLGTTSGGMSQSLSWWRYLLHIPILVVRAQVDQSTMQSSIPSEHTSTLPLFLFDPFFLQRVQRHVPSVASAGQLGALKAPRLDLSDARNPLKIKQVPHYIQVLNAWMKLHQDMGIVPIATTLQGQLFFSQPSIMASSEIAPFLEQSASESLSQEQVHKISQINPALGILFDLERRQERSSQGVAPAGLLRLLKKQQEKDATLRWLAHMTGDTEAEKKRAEILKTRALPYHDIDIYVGENSLEGQSSLLPLHTVGDEKRDKGRGPDQTLDELSSSVDTADNPYEIFPEEVD